MSIFPQPPYKKSPPGRIRPMSETTSELQPELPGLEKPTREIGTLEVEVLKQVEQLRSLGYIEDHHSGKVALALTCARDLDASIGRGAPSGRANLLRVMNEILETLPQPEAASKDKLDDVVAALMHDDDEDAQHAPARADA